MGPQPTLLTVQDERPIFQPSPPPEPEEPNFEVDAPHYRLASSCVDDLQTDIASILGRLQGRAADREVKEQVPEAPRLPSKSPVFDSPHIPAAVLDNPDILAAPALRPGKTFVDVYALVDDLDADVHKLVNSRESLGLVPGPLSFDTDIHSRSTILMQSGSSTSLM